MECFGPPQQLPQGFTATGTSFLFAVKSDGTKKARLVFRNSPMNWFEGGETHPQWQIKL
jgi:hypothetical protein